MPRHHEEIGIDIGDPVYVQKEAEDYWCEGKQTLKGLFPRFFIIKSQLKKPIKI